MELAEAVNGAIPRAAGFTWPWGDALDVLAAVAPDARILNLETAVTRATTRPRPAKRSTTGCTRPTCPPSPPPVRTPAPWPTTMCWTTAAAGWRRPSTPWRTRVFARAGSGAGRRRGRRPADVPSLAAGARPSPWVASSGIPGGWAATAQRSGVDFVAEPSDAAAAGIATRLRPAKRPGDIVVVSVHWGSNWGYLVPRDQVRFRPCARRRRRRRARALLAPSAAVGVVPES